MPAYIHKTTRTNLYIMVIPIYDTDRRPVPKVRNQAPRVCRSNEDGLLCNYTHMYFCKEFFRKLLCMYARIYSCVYMYVCMYAFALEHLGQRVGEDMDGPYVRMSVVHVCARATHVYMYECILRTCVFAFEPQDRT